MDNDPYILVGKKLIEPLVEGFSGAFRLSVALVKAPFVVLYNFINRKDL